MKFILHYKTKDENLMAYINKKKSVKNNTLNSLK